MVSAANDLKRWMLMLGGLCLVGWGVVVMLQMGHGPADVESQMAHALGCRNSQEVLVLKVAYDGAVAWPDGAMESVERSCLLLQARHAEDDDLAVGILADPDVPMRMVRPLFEAAQSFGVRRAIFALRDDGSVDLRSRPMY